MSENALEEILAWAASKIGFGHIKAGDGWYPALRAATLIDRLRTKNRVVYDVPTNHEKELMVEALRLDKVVVEDKFGVGIKACIISHADLYGLAKLAGNGGLLDPDVVVVCEFDI
ncbi:hypothetical protein QQZ08_007084 [Neonectria magnoliae]|uniref:Uncharacterized protein n=1 Tax=Neonectria magnoliae TaxID=2732573 RepID=A0ABR1HZ25_9HYPO